MDGNDSHRQGAQSAISMFDRKQYQLMLSDLPAPDTKRWVIRRKAAVVAAVKSGVITLDEVCQRYNISPQEFVIWQELIEKHGVRGLRVTRLKDYRKSKSTPIPEMD
jgi:hypothetical protein